MASEGWLGHVAVAGIGLETRLTGPEVRHCCEVLSLKPGDKWGL